MPEVSLPPPTSPREEKKPPPLMSSRDMTSASLEETVINGQVIPCFNIGGEMRLCFPQILKQILGGFHMEQICLACEELLIHVAPATNQQLSALKGKIHKYVFEMYFNVVFSRSRSVASHCAPMRSYHQKWRWALGRFSQHLPNHCGIEAEWWPQRCRWGSSGSSCPTRMFWQSLWKIVSRLIPKSHGKMYQL